MIMVKFPSPLNISSHELYRSDKILYAHFKLLATGTVAYLHVSIFRPPSATRKLVDLCPFLRLHPGVTFDRFADKMSILLQFRERTPRRKTHRVSTLHRDEVHGDTDLWLFNYHVTITKRFRLYGFQCFAV